jgi:hypothetical protein
LYDRVDFIHLGFGDRLPHPHGFIPGDHDDAAEFVRRIEPYEAATYAWRDLGGFLSLTESLQHVENPWIRRGRALTLVMLGRGREAELQLKVLAEAHGVGNLPHFREDLEQVSAELSRGVERAKSLLLGWEAQTKARFEVQS